MKCPYCGSKTSVTNSRSRAKGSQIWRRRECQSCSSVWTTHEVIDLSTSHKVENSRGHIAAFSRDKLFMSIQDSLRHRKTALSDATALTDTVLTRILALNSPIVKNPDISRLIFEVINKFDKTAAAVYRATRF